MNSTVYIRDGHWVGRLAEIIERDGDELTVDIVNDEAQTTVHVDDVRFLE